MAKKSKRQCNKGYSCKYSCISRSKQCQNPLSGQGKDYAEFLKKNPDYYSKQPKSTKDLRQSLVDRGVDLSTLKGNGRGRATLEKALSVLDKGKELREAGVLKPVKVETALSRSRREAKERREREYTEASNAATLARQQQEIISRHYSKRNLPLSAEDAKILGRKPGQFTPNYQDVKKAKDALDEANQRLNTLAQSSQKVEVFQTGRPLSAAQMNRKPSQAELDGAPTFPSRAQLQQMYYSNRERYDRINNQIQQYNKAKESNPDLLPQEYLAINAYTRGNGYIGPNSAARGFFQDPNSEAARSATTQARLMHSALGQLPAWEGTVRRDTQIPAAQANFNPGDRITLNGITSTTRDLTGSRTSIYGSGGQSLTNTGEGTKASSYDQVAAQLGINTIPPGDKVRVRYMMEVRTGRDVSQLSAASSEQEISLRHGWQGTVSRTEVDPNTGALVVYVSED